MLTTTKLSGLPTVVAAVEGKPLEEAAWQTWRNPGLAQEDRDTAARITTVKWLAVTALVPSAVLFWTGLANFGVVATTFVTSATVAVFLQVLQSRKRRTLRIASKGTLAGMLVLGAASAAGPADLSRYRTFQLGTDLATIAAQTGEKATEAKLVAARPERVQELEWSPQSAHSHADMESAKKVLFSFYNDHLYRITVDYDRYKTEGLTADDIIEAVSESNGTVPTHPVADKDAQGFYPVSEEVMARWEDTQYRVELVRETYGPLYKLVTTAKSLDMTAQAALVESKRLDEQEAPQREAARAADQAQSERARLDKIRLVNKPKFRP